MLLDLNQYAIDRRNINLGQGIEFLNQMDDYLINLLRVHTINLTIQVTWKQVLLKSIDYKQIITNNKLINI